MKAGHFPLWLSINPEGLSWMIGYPWKQICKSLPHCIFDNAVLLREEKTKCIKINRNFFLIIQLQFVTDNFAVQFYLLGKIFKTQDTSRKSFNKGFG